jgi:hypothetical protein
MIPLNTFSKNHFPYKNPEEVLAHHFPTIFPLRLAIRESGPDFMKRIKITTIPIETVMNNRTIVMLSKIIPYSPFTLINPRQIPEAELTKVQVCVGEFSKHSKSFELLFYLGTSKKENC